RAGGVAHLVGYDRRLLARGVGDLVGLLLDPRVLTHLVDGAHDLFVALASGAAAQHVAEPEGNQQRQLLHGVFSLVSVVLVSVVSASSACSRMARPRARSFCSFFCAFLIPRVSRAGSWSSASAAIPACS